VSEDARPRVVVLGASNVSRGASTVVETARRVLGARAIDVFAAIGHGRSFGIESTVAGRSLPGILQCGLWQALRRDERDAQASRPTFALITDIGNDIMYDQPVDQILAWVRECIDRLRAFDARTIATAPPIGSIRTVTPRRYGLVKGLLFPGCRITYEQAVERAEALHAGVHALAGEAGVHVVEPPASWYGRDPIHIRLRVASRAWRTVLHSWGAAGDEAPPVRFSLRRWLTLRTSPPARYRLFGIGLGAVQPSGRLPGGTLVHLY